MMIDHTFQGLGSRWQRDYVRSLAFKSDIHHGTDSIIVIPEQHFMRSEPFGRSHTAPPLIKNDDRVSRFIFRDV
jgi:hypothetical protein